MDRLAQNLAAAFSGLLFLAALLYPLTFISVAAPAPCADASWYLVAARLLVVSALVGGAVWLRRVRSHPSLRDVSGVIVLVLLAIGLNLMANQDDMARQANCARRSLDETMTACRANPTHYKRGRDQYGYATLTLVAPGTTDSAWNCLSNWATHNGSTSLKVDESVYEEYRRKHPRR